MSHEEASIKLHELHRGKIEVRSKVPLHNRLDLSTAYTPGVAEPCRRIARHPELVYRYTIKANTVAIVSDGSAVLGLGNIGPLAAIPVMEGKALLFKAFADVDAFPICLDTQNVDEIVETVERIAPVFGGINLEDISAPRCFEIERRLRKGLEIPVFHDDQHGTAIVLLAALTNACKLLDRGLDDLAVVIQGAGAAGVAIAKLLLGIGIEDGSVAPVREVIIVDSRGPLHRDRADLAAGSVKRQMAEITNPRQITGSLEEALIGADAFIGVSVPDTVTPVMVASMAPDPIIFALANPDPEIGYYEALEAGAAVAATGRSDYPNQINNVLAFPGVMRGALDAESHKITEPMKVAAARAIASCVEQPRSDRIIPDALDRQVPGRVAEAVRRVGDGEPAA
ncbi:MAG: NADP-dependent malic enzyme, partial [Acidobacteriota bacterium]|nr:NADP-dependent malic enzyme [Acidobacteriota bacterium]